MDLLSQRYASPFFVLDDFIRLEQLHEFCVTIIKQINDEEIEKYKWEYYLHKVYDRSYEEYLSDIEKDKQEKETDGQSLTDIVNESASLIDLFN